MEQALTGVRVLDLSGNVAGAYGAKLLADFGAEVLKVEPPEGDHLRRLGPFPGDIPNPEKSGLFLWLNLNKQGITLDVCTATGLELLRRLVAQADILISTFPPGEVEGLGLTYDSLAPYNPAIVVAAITPFGMAGRYRDYRATEIVLDAWGHAMSSTGAPDREPLKIGGFLRHYFTGQVVAVAALGAEMEAELSGRGQMLDISMMDVQAGSIDRRSTYLLRYQYLGEIVSRESARMRVGNVQFGFHPCKDGWVSGGISPFSWPKFCNMLGHPEWATDPRYNPIREKMESGAVQEELEGHFLHWLMQRTRAEVFEEAKRFKVEIFPVNTFGDLIHDKLWQERNFWVEAEHPEAGKLTNPGGPFEMGEGGFALRRPAPTLGQHNTELYCGQLGLSPADLANLSQQGVI